jgi:DNA-binding FadR family transcriptional regulator
MPVTAIEPQRLYRQIAAQLSALISQGEFAAGSRLPAERDLATQLGVSRPSVREALIALEVEGLIEVRTGSGIYVRQQAASAALASASNPQEWGPLALMRARQLVESEVAALAAEHASSVHLRQMQEALQSMKDDAQQGRSPMQGDQAFHTAIAKACGNEVLLETVHQYWRARQAPLSVRLYDYFEHPQAWQLAYAEHHVIYEAICSKQPPKARRAMNSHLKKALSRYSASWRSAQHPSHPIASNLPTIHRRQA